MKRLFAALALAAAPLMAHAWGIETGMGYTWSKGMGDGTWYQEGVPHETQLKTRAYLLGLYATPYENGPFDVRAHADYVYYGTQRASCMCVPDSEYNPHTHEAAVPGYIPFNGSGHVQGVALTLEPAYTWHGVRFGAEAGPWLFWPTWHVTRVDPAYPGNDNLSHRTTLQVGWVAGLRVESGNTSFSYRYYRQPEKWNEYPAWVTATHMFMLVHKF